MSWNYYSPVAVLGRVERGSSRDAVRLLSELRMMSLRRAKGELSPAMRPVGDDLQTCHTNH